MFGKVIVSVVRSNILRDTCNCLLIRKHANASITLREQCHFNYERHKMVVNKKRNLNSSHILLNLKQQLKHSKNSIFIIFLKFEMAKQIIV